MELLLDFFEVLECFETLKFEMQHLVWSISQFLDSVRVGTCSTFPTGLNSEIAKIQRLNRSRTCTT